MMTAHRRAHLLNTARFVPDYSCWKEGK